MPVGIAVGEPIGDVSTFHSVLFAAISNARTQILQLGPLELELPHLCFRGIDRDCTHALDRVFP